MLGVVVGEEEGGRRRQRRALVGAIDSGEVAFKVAAMDEAEESGVDGNGDRSEMVRLVRVDQSL